MFEPSWTAKIGPVTEKGKGLMSGIVFRQRHLVDEFTVWLNTHRITVRPKAGIIERDNAVVENVGGPAQLLWFRRMAQQIATHDENHAGPDCRWYGLGLETAKEKIGFHIFPDSTSRFEWL